MGVAIRMIRWRPCHSHAQFKIQYRISSWTVLASFGPSSPSSWCLSTMYALPWPDHHSPPTSYSPLNLSIFFQLLRIHILLRFVWMLYLGTCSFSFSSLRCSSFLGMDSDFIVLDRAWIWIALYISATSASQCHTLHFVLGYPSHSIPPLAFHTYILCQTLHTSTALFTYVSPTSRAIIQNYYCPRVRLSHNPFYLLKLLCPYILSVVDIPAYLSQHKLGRQLCVYQNAECQQ
ncbi:hypothetical protein K503DRAFT_130745 [Rhizopogon vinicolor AM-OR11-026]|uniref:Uncharacterized protein n=1 Tax=Rhizopogon vinicolor AM-OR11-026 TaxID=1314800 RepID=A0A1B7N1V4_9AGAM|nr:hypothetical protein K503DRAFT_130745 [Rhizopogon vinicolor AM-OR11-026]